ncbi:MAG: hypothetical protein ACTSO7_04965 [Candidatus Heimdallarchaeota archaeon]
MSDKDNLFKVRREADEDGPIHKSGKSQFCGNCGHVVSDSINSWCEKCRAPLDDDTRIQLLSRDDPVIINAGNAKVLLLETCVEYVAVL